MATDYEGSVEQVHEAFATSGTGWPGWPTPAPTTRAWTRCVWTTTAASTVATTQVLRADRLPGIVTQFHRGDLKIQRVESWTGLVDGTATAAVTGAIAAAPVALSGDAHLAPSDAHARLAFRATVEVRIPLVGGKVENFIGNQLVELLIAEQRFTTMWIAENR